MRRKRADLNEKLWQMTAFEPEEGLDAQEAARQRLAEMKHPRFAVDGCAGRFLLPPSNGVLTGSHKSAAQAHILAVAEWLR